ncbi:hypothetical protein WG68_12730 [Arsukibacterium ikkense]|uniref:diguanylate cyclase n=1 Tax=Arsukibacterium ikkense TaxID=336831 RepID=A0A0M2V3L2_9GAMM|nr:GGDEF domain-containing protein [Arsukibacterium ikkense]KKO44999.1 hypothetical protein WG68_12730 [Arsukibacterium ikkense]
MDELTLLTVNFIVAFIVLVTMAGLYQTSKADHCLIHWSLAGLGFLVNSAIGLIYAPLGLPYFLGPPLGNSALIASYLLLLSGVASYLAKPVSWRLLGVLLASIYLLSLSSFAQADVIHRFLLSYPILIAANLYTIWLLVSSRQAGLRASSIVLLGILCFNALQLSLRLITFLLDQMQLTAFSINWLLHTIGTLAVMLFMLLSMVGCVLLWARKKELALRQLAETDALTGWLNRQSMAEKMQAELHLCQRQRLPFSLLTFDIDHFKQINDKHGHSIGDTVLQDIAWLGKTILRDYDLLFRTGGEEFVACLPGVTPDQASAIARRFKNAVAKHHFNNSSTLKVTISQGIAGTANAYSNPETIASLQQQADHALYQAKQQGRDQVRLFAATCS